MEDEVRQYRVQSTSPQSASVEDIEISRSDDGTRRKVLRTLIVINEHDENQSVKAAIICQRRSSQVDWADIEGTPLSRLHAGDASKMLLDSSETFQLVNRLNDLYGIDQTGVMRGQRVLNVAREDAVIETETGKARLLRKIAQSENLEDLASINDSEHMTPSEAFALTKLHASRTNTISQFTRMLETNPNENTWKAFLSENNWIFGVANIEIIDESRLGIHHDTDIPLAVDGDFMDIIELKLPQQEFWRRNSDGSFFLYRSKFPVVRQEVTEGIAQLSGYILEAEKNVNNVDFIRDHDGKIPLKPRGTLVIGRSKDWAIEEWQAYRLLNDELHGIQVITYDQVLNRAKNGLSNLQV